MDMYSNKTISTKELLKGNTPIALKGYTVAEIERTVAKYGDVAIPTTVLNIIADVRNSKSKYGIMATTKFLYDSIGVWDMVNKSAYKIVDRFVRKNRLIYLKVFDQLADKSFTSYVCCIDQIMGADMGAMAEILAKGCNLPIEVAKDIIGIVVYLNSYNGLIMEYMVSEMVATHPTLSVMREGVVFDGYRISPSVLDKDWGIDLIISVGEEIHIPLQIKSFTHLGKSRAVLQHTFEAHRDYKNKYKGLLAKESKGNVYFLHYRITDLTITVPRADFSHTLPQSRELINRVFDTTLLDLRTVPIWEVCHILEDVAMQIIEDIGA